MEIPSSIRQGLAQRYDLTGVLGTGGMATVYRATDLRHHREVAVKVMRPELTASFAVDRFLKEISISAGLHHPHILTLIDSGEVDGIPYYVMPLVDGESLRLLMDRLGPQSLEETLGVVTEVADALDYAHRRGVIHRDIKPENILLADGHAVVADFGIAKAITSAGGATLTKTGMPVGTPGYMSPEQAAGLPDLDTRSDVFSLACVCFEMLVGEPPGMWPNGDDQRSGHFQRATTHRARLDALPRSVEAALVHAMAIDPGARPTSPSAFVRALQRRTDQASTRRYGRNEVEQIIRHAAEIEAQPTVDPAVTIGGVEALAADVGIAPARIQEAAHALDRTEIALRPGGVLGLQPQLQVERVVDGEMSSEVYASVLEEIRVALGETGTLAETLGDSLVWNSPTGGTGRKARVMVSPSGGKTRIRIQDDDGEPGSGFVMAPIVTISVVLIGITGAIVNDATGSNLWGLIAAFGVSSSFFGTTWLIARRSFRRRMTERATQLDQLMRRLTGMVRTAPSSTDD